MDSNKKILQELISNNTYKTLPQFLNRFEYFITYEIGVHCTDSIVTDFIEKDFFDEMKILSQSKASLYFGKTLRDLKFVIPDQESREHEIWVKYVGPKKLRITDMSVPWSHIQDEDYRSLDEVINVFNKHLLELTKYLYELDQISQYCRIMEPVRPTYKENYRRIYLADKIWLHVDVSPKGSARNFRVIGQFDQQLLQEFLQAWNHDINIAANVMKIISSLNSDNDTMENMVPEINAVAQVPSCGICLCVELPDDTRVPQPICNNPSCGVYFHRSCLCAWLVACEGGRQPRFGIGKCPSCLHQIQCSDRDN